MNYKVKGLPVKEGKIRKIAKKLIVKLNNGCRISGNLQQRCSVHPVSSVTAARTEKIVGNFQLP